MKTKRLQSYPIFINKRIIPIGLKDNLIISAALAVAALHQRRLLSEPEQVLLEFRSFAELLNFDRCELVL